MLATKGTYSAKELAEVGTKAFNARIYKGSGLSVYLSNPMPNTKIMA